MNLTKNPLFYLSLVLAVIVGLQAWTLVQADFSPPTSAFPTSDVSAPLETSGTEQTKGGAIRFGTVDSPSVKISPLSGLCLRNSSGYMECKRFWIGVNVPGGFLTLHSSSTALLATDSGNVGIGTYTPDSSYALDIVGDMNLTGTIFQGGNPLVTGHWTKSGDNVYYFPVNYTVYDTPMYNNNPICGNTATVDYWCSNVQDHDGGEPGSSIGGGYPCSNWGGTWSTIGGVHTKANCYDSSSGSVGIGTASPGAKLEVAGQIKITGGSPGSGKVLISNASGLASWEEQVSRVWNLVDNDIFYSGGSVVIGDAIAVAGSINALVVAYGGDEANAGVVADFQSGSVDGAYIGILRMGVKRWVIGVDVDSNLKIREHTNTGAVAMVFTEGGNIGIGVDPGSYKLFVDGDVHVDGDLTVGGTLAVGGYDRIIIKPTDFVKTLHAQNDKNIRLNPFGNAVAVANVCGSEIGADSTDNDVGCRMSASYVIPKGYKATEFYIYADGDFDGNDIGAFSGSITSDSYTKLGIGNDNTLIDITDVVGDNTTYITITIVDDGSRGWVYGGYITLVKI